MKIAVASGKGGTGKTTVSLNLALSLENVQLLDCDVEEPNCNLFLDHELEKVRDVQVQVPVISKERCDLCMKCVDACRFNALAKLLKSVMFFPKLCHGCGACSLVCPLGAIHEEGRSIGIIERSASSSSGTELYQGLLSIGEPMASPIIHALKTYIDDTRTVIIDSPPGLACPAISAITGTDYCVLVTEPTPFGLHDLSLAVELLKELHIPYGVVINRYGIGDERVDRYCSENNIPVLMKIPNELKIAELYSQGIPFVLKMPQWKANFLDMFSQIQKLTGRC
ncbi:ATP-binding protein [Methanomethylovorans sp.]|uniref:ATP-binding protein n=1 Tax=Methanomethylovorans sp. TaxID=2758717 RepID=UPI000A9421BF|nr:ATP-binding protein [Methanomethylovorans sp.]